MNHPVDLVYVAPSKRKRRSRQRPRRSNPPFLTVLLSLIGVNWIGLALILYYFYPHRIGLEITLAAAGCLHFGVAYAVHHRRKYILEIAFAFAGIGVLLVPLGTVLSICLMCGLMSKRHDFTR